VDLVDGEFAKIAVWPPAGSKAQAAFHGPRKPFVNNPVLILGRDGRQSSVVAENLADAVLADEPEQVLVDIAELGLGRTLLPNHGDARLDCPENSSAAANYRENPGATSRAAHANRHRSRAND
jgi:hypothetical protein